MEREQTGGARHGRPGRLTWARPLALGLALCLLSSGCAGWYDLFHRDHPPEALIQQALAVPGPAVADVALVLGCPAIGEGPRRGRLAECQRCRVDAAAAAFRAGRARYLLFSGGAAHNRYVEADVMARAVIARGVPADRVLREGQALTTWQNVRFGKRIMAARGLRTALVISVADHLPRARRFVDYYGVPATYAACDRDGAAAASSAPGAPAAVP